MDRQCSAHAARESSDTPREGQCNVRRSNKRRENGEGRGLQLPPARQRYFSTERHDRQQKPLGRRVYPQDKRKLPCPDGRLLPSSRHLIERNTVDVEFARSVNRIDAAGRTEPGAHDDRLRSRSTPEIVHPSEQLSVRYSCGREKDVVAAN